MLGNILATIELSGVEKILRLQENWMTICHIAHLSGNQSIIVENISNVIPHLLKRHPRMRSCIQINGNQPVLEVLDYDEDYFKPKLFYSISKGNDQSWEKIAEDECDRNPYTNEGRTIFPLPSVKHHFLFASTSNTLYSRLREKCHSEHVTLHGPVGVFYHTSAVLMITMVS